MEEPGETWMSIFDWRLRWSMSSLVVVSFPILSSPIYYFGREVFLSVMFPILASSVQVSSWTADQVRGFCGFFLFTCFSSVVSM